MLEELLWCCGGKPCCGEEEVVEEERGREKVTAPTKLKYEYFVDKCKEEGAQVDGAGEEK